MTETLRKTFRGIRKIATIIAVVYVATLGALYFFQEHMIFFPRAESPGAGEKYAEFEVSFEVNDELLDGWYIPGDVPQTLVYYGGNGEELSRSLDTITRIGGLSYLLVNYRGYGESTGQPSEQSLKSDALGVIDQASRRFMFDIEEAIVMGRSLGTGVAMYVAANRAVKALILVSPYDSVEAIARDRYPMFPIAALLRHPFRSIDYVDNTTMPTLILKSGRDDIVPHEHTNNLIDQWRGPLWTYTLPGTTHNRITTDEYYRRIRDFVTTVMSERVSQIQ